MKLESFQRGSSGLDPERIPLQGQGPARGKGSITKGEVNAPQFYGEKPASPAVEPRMARVLEQLGPGRGGRNLS